MDVRKAAAVLLIIALVSVTFSATVPESDAAEAGDVIINVDGSGDSIHLDVDSGTTSSVTVYVTNNSDSYLSLDVPTYSDDSISTDASVSVGGSNSNLIYPKGDSDGRHIAVVTLTVSVDRLADTQSLSGDLTLRFTDVTVESPEGANVFERVVPFTVDINSVYTSEGSYNQFFGIFPNTLPEPFDEPWFAAVVTLILWILITVVVCELVIPQLTKIVGSRKTETEKRKLTKTLTKTISVLMFVVAVNECLNILGTNAEIISPVTLLYQTGYLTIREYFPDTNEYLLGWPNREVESGFTESLAQLYIPKEEEVSEFSVNRFSQDLRNGDPEMFMQRLKAFMADNDYHVQGKAELYMQNTMYVFLKLLGQRVEVERHTANGRIDILIQTDRFVYIIELKRDKDPGNALDQIETKGYEWPFQADSRKIFRIGASFSTKTRRIEEWKVEE